MADNAPSKIDAAAEKAYAEAAAKAKAADAAVSEKAIAKAVDAGETKPEAKAKVVAKAVEAPAKKKTAAKRKTSAKKVAAKKVATKKAKPVAKKAAAKKISAQKAPVRKASIKAVKPVQSATKLKEKLMATAKNTEYTKAAKEMAADVQTRLKGAYAKSGEFASDAGEFSKANVEALVEAGKIFVAGVQDLGRQDLENGKAVVSTVTADVKKMATVKSPTELMQLQGELVRRNFDVAVAFGSKRTEELVKLYNEAFAPISSRVSVAAEKISKAA